MIFFTRGDTDGYITICCLVMILSINRSKCLCLNNGYLLMVTLLTLIDDLDYVLNLCEAFPYSNTVPHK